MDLKRLKLLMLVGFKCNIIKKNFPQKTLSAVYDLTVLIFNKRGDLSCEYKFQKL